MTDILERLRAAKSGVCDEAADLIWLLRQDNQRLLEDCNRFEDAAHKYRAVLEQYDKLTCHDGWYADLVKEVLK